jgi:cytidine deaminase
MPPILQDCALSGCHVLRQRHLAQGRHHPFGRGSQKWKAFINLPIAPCGACRQSLLEAEHRQVSPIKVLLYGAGETACIESVKALLPLSFDESFLNE